MTKPLPDALITGAFVKRPVSSFRVREDFIETVRADCKRLNCSKGVYFEVLLEKAWKLELITSDDVFAYDAKLRWESERSNEPT